ncbi:3-dehydroquinate synthase [Caldalkalibacillus salinus]|uniref:3-dehydroquinate synthase n=1 Tax=Caldalkalibacillus salinus TaxID=2803787 RepID=UPI001920DCD9|nr:3-dehydroquinate synthase [Caldalkalibacillus salinus]
MATHKQLEVKTLHVELGERSYPIVIGPNVLHDIGQYLEQLGIHDHQQILIITDDQVKALHADALTQRLDETNYRYHVYAVPSGERSKSLNTYEDVITFMIDKQFDRKSVVLALGGGVVGDLAGFVASSYMRGIDFIQLPTTIQAHDSSVGGKVGINHALGKNMIGAFHQPLAVLYDTSILKTLPLREIKSGYAELIKYGMIWDASFATWLDQHANECLQLQEPYLTEALYKGCEIKAEIVSQDEKETGIRSLLNFGHTFGHALENLGQYTRLTHGEAIAIGMVLAGEVSEHHYQITNIKERVLALVQKFGLPYERPREWTVEDILSLMYRDKKSTGGQLNLILVTKVGHAVLEQGVAPKLVKQVLKGEGGA